MLEEIGHITFTGDDGTASGVTCTEARNGVYYAANNSDITFTLPPEYACTMAQQDAGVPTRWHVQAQFSSGASEFTVECHKCASAAWLHDDTNEWQLCDTCRRKINEGPYTPPGTTDPGSVDPAPIDPEPLLPPTGDSTPVTLLTAVLLLSLAALFVTKKRVR